MPKDISRKEFLVKTMTGVAAFGLIQGKLIGANQLDVHLRSLGKTGLKVSPLCFGAPRTNDESLIKYSVEKGKIINGLTAQSLNKNPLRFNIEMNVRGSVQMCLLIRNVSKNPEKVIVKYQGITQEFLVNWNEWGWAPITLLKEFPADEKVDFEISAFDQNSLLEISKIYFRYQDIGHTD